MKMKFLVTCFLLFHYIFIIQAEQNDIEKFIESNRKFTTKIYQYASEKYEDNFIFSPFSLEIILALISEGARGQTKEEVINGLFLPDSTAVRNALRTLLQNDISKDGVELINTNAIFANNGISLKPNFEQVASEVYRAEFQNLNFADSAGSANSINTWVDEHTNHKITNLINPDSIDSYTELLLVNAIYFNAAWEHKFSVEGTINGTFYDFGVVPVKIPLMRTSYSYNYYKSDEFGASFIELPYKGENLSMVIILPNNNEGLKDVEFDVEALFETPQWKKEPMEITLPRFIVESSFQFPEMLRNLGITKIFSQEAELDDFVETGIRITEIVQKAFINVSETGTEAAAATISFEDRSKPDNMNINHPFMYYIQKDGVILFCGRVVSFESDMMVVK